VLRCLPQSVADSEEYPKAEKAEKAKRKRKNG
jgi:hypothetical protein